VTAPAAEVFGGRRLAALLLVPLLLGLHWYVARPDVVAVQTSEGWWSVTPWALGPMASFVAVFTLLGVLPAVVGVTLFRWPAARLGLTAGALRPGLLFSAVGVSLALIAGLIGARSASFAAIYPLGLDAAAPTGAVVTHAAGYLLYYAGFEFFFRGYLLSGVGRPLGPRTANVLQAVLATLIHAGRPAGEFAAALPASLAFGWLAQRTGSIWYGTVIHWSIGVSLDLFLIAKG
jgi:membrane protease YdiL (CAAX protease family)